MARKSPAESRFENLVYLVLVALAIDAAMVLMVLTVVADGGAFGIAKLRGRRSRGLYLTRGLWSRLRHRRASAARGSE